MEPLKVIEEIQKKCRDLENILTPITNREIELAIINLQQAAHWAYHGVMRHATTSTDKKDHIIDEKATNN